MTGANEIELDRLADDGCPNAVEITVPSDFVATEIGKAFLRKEMLVAARMGHVTALTPLGREVAGHLVEMGLLAEAESGVFKRDCDLDRFDEFVAAFRERFVRLFYGDQS